MIKSRTCRGQTPGVHADLHHVDLNCLVEPPQSILPQSCLLYAQFCGAGQCFPLERSLLVLLLLGLRTAELLSTPAKKVEEPLSVDALLLWAAQVAVDLANTTFGLAIIKVVDLYVFPFPSVVWPLGNLPAFHPWGWGGFQCTKGRLDFCQVCMRRLINQRMVKYRIEFLNIPCFFFLLGQGVYHLSYWVTSTWWLWLNVPGEER